MPPQRPTHDQLRVMGGAPGTTPEAMQAGAQNAQLLDGTTSNALKSSLYTNTSAFASAQKEFGSTTISQAMSADPSIQALSALSGNSIYINPGTTALSSANTFWDNRAMIAHELVHNVTGKTDDVIQDKLGLKVQKDTKNISDKLKSDCF